MSQPSFRLRPTASRGLELPLLPRLDPGVVVVAREHPSEGAERTLPTPAVRVAIAGHEARDLPDSVVQSQQDVNNKELSSGHRRPRRKEEPQCGQPEHGSDELGDYEHRYGFGGDPCEGVGDRASDRGGGIGERRR